MRSAHLDERFEEWNLLELGESSGEDGQACLEAKLTRVLPEIAEWAASLPHPAWRSTPGSVTQVRSLLIRRRH